MSIDPSDYVVREGDVVENVDLDDEELRLSDGRRLTSELTKQLARAGVGEVRRRNLIPGRKSLSGDGSHSRTVQFGVPDALREAAEAKAAETGVSLSVLARTALEHISNPRETERNDRPDGHSRNGCAAS